MRPIVIRLPNDLDTSKDEVEVLVRTDPEVEVDVRENHGVWTPIALLGGQWELR